MPTKTFKRLDDEKKERILRSSISEFHTHGFEKAKIENIAQKAEVATGSMYQYFEDKKELFHYCATWSLEYFFKEVNLQTPMSEMDIFDYCLSNSRQRIDLLKKDPLLLLFMQDLTSSKFGSLTAESMKEIMQLDNEYMLNMVINGKKKGTIREDVDDDLLVMFINGAVSKVDEYIFEEGLKDNFEYANEQYTKVENILNKMVLLLKEGIGRC